MDRTDTRNAGHEYMTFLNTVAGLHGGDNFDVQHYIHHYETREVQVSQDTAVFSPGKEGEFSRTNLFIKPQDGEQEQVRVGVVDTFIYLQIGPVDIYVRPETAARLYDVMHEVIG